MNQQVNTVGNAEESSSPVYPDLCQGPDCSTTFEPRKGKRFCGNSCRARANDIKKAERLQAALLSRELTDSELRQLVKLIGGKLPEGKLLNPEKADPERIVKFCKGHARVLYFIDMNGDFAPAYHSGPFYEPIRSGDGNRARELVRAGLLQKHDASVAECRSRFFDKEASRHVAVYTRTPVEDVPKDTRERWSRFIKRTGGTL